MACRTLAMMNTHRKVRRSPRSKVTERSPYVCMGVPFAASRVLVLRVLVRSLRLAGTTLTSAPVSIKNLKPVCRSVRKNSVRRSGDVPTALAVLSCWMESFPQKNKEDNSCGLASRTECGTSTLYRRVPWNGCYGVVWIATCESGDEVLVHASFR